MLLTRLVRNGIILNMGTIKWLSSTECNFCHQDAKEVSRYFVDGKTVLGPWALMCRTCFYHNGTGHGIGKGQMYDSVTLEKIA